MCGSSGPPLSYFRKFVDIEELKDNFNYDAKNEIHASFLMMCLCLNFLNNPPLMHGFQFLFAPRETSLLCKLFEAVSYFSSLGVVEWQLCILIYYSHSC